MQALDKDLRSTLEKVVKAARAVAETAAQAAVDQLGVSHEKPEAFLGDREKALRNRLRTHGKQLGDACDSKSSNPTHGKQEVQHLVQEVAYEHWHRMLFARFLADNNLLMYDGVAVTIEECDELAPDEGAKSAWELAGKLAARMLPQVFKPGSPVFELTFAPEHQNELERLLKNLPDAVFKASDSLGWVYQFWQADNKERINKSEVKIGADELPAVTQLFTEPYMVAFLLHNSLGAWWSTRHPGKPCPVNLDYLRSLEDGTPAAGKFKGWPDSLADFKLLDPCCGSGHFLVAAFLMLVPMRMAAEGLNAKEAVNRVLAENIHGLELDPRCVEIAVFAVALEAWRYLDASGKSLGVREIPAPNIACCGLKVAAKAQDWEDLVPDGDPNARSQRDGLRQLHEVFAQAPLLGSLLDPRQVYRSDLFAADFDHLTELLSRALGLESGDQIEGAWDAALSAKGLLDVAHILSGSYHLVITNVPYLARGKHSDHLVNFADRHYFDARKDLAAIFTDRIHRLLNGGVACLVVPQNLFQLTGYTEFRRRLFRKTTFGAFARLGPRAFETISGENVSVALVIFEDSPSEEGHLISAVEASDLSTAPEKSLALRFGQLISIDQNRQLSNPDSRLILSKNDQSEGLLSDISDGIHGLGTKDSPMFIRNFWELASRTADWEFVQASINSQGDWTGLESVIYWQQGNGELHERASTGKAILAGAMAHGKPGVLVSPVGEMRSALYHGALFDKSTAVISPLDEDDVAAIYCYVQSQDFKKEIKLLDSKVAVTNKTLVKVPFDSVYWRRIADERYPNGLPKPYSDNPTQWIFHGHSPTSTHPLQVAVARLVGYRWPVEFDDKMELSQEARAWIARSKAIESHADKDGIVCIPPVGRESSASDRLLNLLAAAYGDAWANDTLGHLLAAADHAGKSLETWLRDKFFTQHCALFGNRPFIWHVWDGLRDGFAALINCHKLDYKTLEALIYTYLGDWIGRQKRDAENGVDGAQEKLAAAETLKKRLELILAGEAPYDIFVRWKPIEKQPIGWNPDLNDGVRMNIRPFLSVPDVGKRGAGVLRDKLTIKWEKDRGSDVPSAPWYELGLQYGGKVGDRINDHHLSLAEKQAAREKAK
jgi:hypothetical protein